MGKGGSDGKTGNEPRDPGTPGSDRSLLQFAFECPRSWNALTPTADPSVRHCDHCDQAVHLCTDAEAARRHARVARCVAVPTLVPPYRGTVDVPRTVVVRRGNEPGPMSIGFVLDAQDPATNHLASPLGWLVIVDGPQRGLLFELGYGTTVIGSGLTAQLRLEHDNDVRAEHSRIDVRRGDRPALDKFRLQGAYVDDKLATSVVLWDGDIFIVGNTSIAFKRVD